MKLNALVNSLLPQSEKVWDWKGSAALANTTTAKWQSSKRWPSTAVCFRACMCACGLMVLFCCQADTHSEVGYVNKSWLLALQPSSQSEFIIGASCSCLLPVSHTIEQLLRPSIYCRPRSPVARCPSVTRLSMCKWNYQFSSCHVTNSLGNEWTLYGHPSALHRHHS